MNIYGIKVIVIPDTVSVRRTFWERLFSFDWRSSHKEIPNAATPKDGEVLHDKIHNLMYVNERTYNLMKQTEEFKV